MHPPTSPIPGEPTCLSRRWASEDYAIGTVPSRRGKPVLRAWWGWIRWSGSIADCFPSLHLLCQPFRNWGLHIVYIIRFHKSERLWLTICWCHFNFGAFKVFGINKWRIVESAFAQKPSLEVQNAGLTELSAIIFHFLRPMFRQTRKHQDCAAVIVVLVRNPVI